MIEAICSSKMLEQTPLLLVVVTENICSSRRAISWPLIGRIGRERGRGSDW
jgi:hypothetical protein